MLMEFTCRSRAMDDASCVILCVGIRLGVRIVVQTTLIIENLLHSWDLEDIQCRNKSLDLPSSCLALLAEKELGAVCRFQYMNMGFVRVPGGR
jgi:hypothetical protein